MKKALGTAAAVGLALALVAPPAHAASKEIAQLQHDVELLQQQVRDLKESIDRNQGALKLLVEQALDSVNRMQKAVDGVEQSVQQAQARTNTRVDALTTQMQSLRDAVDELSARLGRISQQLAETQGVLQSVDARLASPPPATPPAGGEQPPPPQPAPPAASAPAAPAPQRPPSATALYDNALRDFINGNYDLARQQFLDYLSYYGRTERAGNAQFYLGEILYRQGDYRGAIAEYDKVLAQYPTNAKVAGAQLKKGYALLELKEREAGMRALQTVIEKFPQSEEAKLARARLERLKESGTR